MRHVGIIAGLLVFVLCGGGLVYPNHNLHTSSQPPVPAAPTTCTLSTYETYFYANQPVDATKAASGTLYKVAADAFGPSAVPYNYEGPSADALNIVQREYLNRLCGYGGPGGDKLLLKMGYTALDVKHMARAANHPDLNPNVLMGNGDIWRQYLKTYLDALHWERSRLEDLPAQNNVWTAAVTPGEVPKVRALQQNLRAGTYLMLVVAQPDGSDFTFRLELGRGFQPVYTSRDEVPAALKA